MSYSLDADFQKRPAAPQPDQSETSVAPEQPPCSSTPAKADPLSETANRSDVSEAEKLQRWTEWVNQPIRPYIIVRPMSGVYIRHNLPDHIVAEQEICEYASQMAKRLHFRLCLVMSRRISRWYSHEGEIEKVTEAQPGIPNIPTMRLDGSEQDFILEQKSDGFKARILDDPVNGKPSNQAQQSS